jgi:hypothetical protein
MMEVSVPDVVNEESPARAANRRGVFGANFSVEGIPHPKKTTTRMTQRHNKIPMMISMASDFSVCILRR